MSTTTLNYAFNINISDSFLEGEKLVFQLREYSFTNFTASMGTESSIEIKNITSQTGYINVECKDTDNSNDDGGFIHLPLISKYSSSNEIVLDPAIGTRYGENFTFVPNPPSSSRTSPSPLYPEYGDVDYPFIISPYDIMIVHLSDNTYQELRVDSVYTDTSNKIHVAFHQYLSFQTRNDIFDGKYKKVLFLKRVEDETNAYIFFKKRDGVTSYGFLIPSDLSTDVLANINEITKQVKQKLLADQQGTTS
jgi:hypothetical protein